MPPLGQPFPPLRACACSTSTTFAPLRISPRKSRHVVFDDEHKAMHEAAGVIQRAYASHLKFEALCARIFGGIVLAEQRQESARVIQCCYRM